jgi:ferrous iron transport protein A
LSVLADLPVGARGRISSIVGSDELSVRLLEMGLTPGVEVTIVGTAPLGDPLELELRGYRLSVRAKQPDEVLRSSQRSGNGAGRRRSRALVGLCSFGGV